MSFNRLFDIIEKEPSEAVTSVTTLLDSAICGKYLNPNKLNVHIDYFIPDGFKHICNVKIKDLTKNFWRYININFNSMFSSHTSWVYFIVVNGAVVKIGETEKPLGVRRKQTAFNDQPGTGTESRFGRLSSHGRKARPNGQRDDTDVVIRDSLREAILGGAEVSLWAKPCEITTVKVTVCGKEYDMPSTTHKPQEIAYLNVCQELVGATPQLNKMLK
jgi:hypothetical protein